MCSEQIVKCQSSPLQQDLVSKLSKHIGILSSKTWSATVRTVDVNCDAQSDNSIPFAFDPRTCVNTAIKVVQKHHGIHRRKLHAASITKRGTSQYRTDTGCHVQLLA